MKPILPFGKYLLLERISVGGMAEVFKARPSDDPTARLLAIKRILPSMAEDADFITMFIDEARISGQLNHPHIAQIYELSQVGESHFIAMEYVWGKDVLQIQNRFRRLKSVMPFPMAAYIAARMCEALDYAHRKKGPDGNPLGIIHRDVSPQNVLVSYQGEVKVIDFGIAKAASRSTKTQAGVLKGKFGYMSPEQVSGQPLDRRSDVFALGTILYEMITADRLFVAESDFATLEKVRNVDVRPPGEVVPGCPEEIDRIVRKALARTVEERYQWAEEMAADLNAWLAALAEPFGERELSAWMQQHFGVEMKREAEALEQQQQQAVAHAWGQVAAAVPAPVALAGVGGGGSFALLSSPEGMTGPAAAADSGGPGLRVSRATQELPADAVLPPLSGAAGGEEMPADATQIMAPELEPIEVPLSAQSTLIADSNQVQAAVLAALAQQGLADPQGTAGELSAESTRILTPEAHDDSLPSLSRPLEDMPSQATAILDSAALRLPPMILPTPPPLQIAPVPQPMAHVPSGPLYAGTNAPGPSQLAAHPPTSRVEAPLAYRQRSTWRNDVLIGFLVAALIIGGALGYRYLQQGPRGTLVVAVSPPSTATITVDGSERGTVLPGKALTLKDVPAGTHRLDVSSAAGSFGDTVEIVAGDISAVTAVLVPAADKTPAAPVAPAPAPSPPPAPSVAAVPSPAAAVAPPTTAAAPEPPQPTAPPTRQPTDTPTDEPVPASARQVHLSPVPAAAPAGDTGKGHLVVRTDPPGADVNVDGKPVGTTPLDIRSVERNRLVRVSIRRKGFATVARYLDFEKEPDRALELTLAPARPGEGGAEPAATAAPAPTAAPASPAAAPASAEVGWLVANTQPWAKVILDGKDTGKSTPIAPVSKLALKPGRHTVTFAVDGKKYSYPIEVKAGETLRVIKTLGGDAPAPK